MAKVTPRSKCLKAAQLHSRLSHADDNGYCTCVSCGVKDHYKNMDGGHYIPKGNSAYWSLEAENIWPQCKGCNGFGMKNGTASISYTMHMIDTYGRDFVDNMIATKSNVKKMYKADYVDLLAELNEKIRYHEDRIGV